MSIATWPIADAAIATGALALKILKAPPHRRTVVKADSSTKPEPR